MDINKKIFQFNNLVFDSIDMIESFSSSQNFKNELTSFTNKHGSYFANKNDCNLYMDVINISLTINIDVSRLNCDYQKYYKDYLKTNLTKVGRLWAMEADTLIWAWAIPTSIGEEYSYYKDKLSIDVEFVLYQGFWNIAKLNNVVYSDWDICSYSDCLSLNHDNCDIYNDCQWCNCENEPTQAEACACCLCREKVCLNDDVLANLKEYCDIEYLLDYKCDYSTEKSWGKKYCTPRSNIRNLYATFYSTTIIPTDDVTIRLKGKFINPVVVVNNKGIKITGEYDGMLIIRKNKVYYLARGCKKEIELSLDKWDVSGSNGLGFEVINGKNTLRVENSECCGIFCAYIDIQNITV